ncbi:hypothetical protein KVV02_000713 [Mortierella alpina]|uniref:Mediator of RNA polymerase II transcription subunit 18 n=1 Tax=Mortierella alpina TaxID=64518 RepID=A0A9P8A1U8_MORAP|nr:hypothetical protein KVV02_000713 [Mortierella alpina]
MAVPGTASGGASFECSLAGTVHAGQFRHLYDRLLGLCEHSAHSKMFEHELLFAPAVQRPMYAARNDEVHLRLRVKLTVLDHANKQRQSELHDSSDRRKKLKGASDGPSNGTPTAAVEAGGETSGTGGTGMNDSQVEIAAPTTAGSSAVAQLDGNSHQGELLQQDIDYYGSLGRSGKTIVSRQYQLCQYGHPEPGRNIVVRSAILVKIHGDAFGFLSLLGYGFEDEYVRRGYNFMYNNICRISVYRKYKLSKQHDPFSAIVPEEEAQGGLGAETASPWLVEISSSFVSQENVNSMSDEINVVRNLLTGSVSF